MKSMSLCLLPCALVFLCACSGEVLIQEEDESGIGVARSTLLEDNALGVNALNLNALSMTTLNANALSPGSMDAASLSAIQGSSANASLARQFVKYSTSCALGPSQSFSFSWTDALNAVHDETYPGLLALATDWPSRALTTQEEEWISACILARVNWYEVPVIISSRGSLDELDTSPGELTNWSYEEGAFWGNLFGNSPHAFACHYVPNIDHSRSKSRDCAAGHLDSQGVPQDCGIIHILGPCSTYCTSSASTGYYPSCSSTGGDASSAVVTVYLK